MNLKFSSLPSQKVIDNKIDITVSVKTTKKTYKMSKIGVAVNPNALSVPAVNPTDGTQNVPNATPNATGDSTDPQTAAPAPPAADPKSSVSKFLSSLNSQNLKGAYETSDNPNWGSFDNFSNPTSGFGGVKSINVKNIAEGSTSSNSSSVNATYDVTDKNGKTTHEERSKPFFYSLFENVLSRFMNDFEGNIAVSEVCAKPFREWFKCEFEVIPNGVPVGEFQALHPKIPSFDDGKINIFFICHFSLDKSK